MMVSLKEAIKHGKLQEFIDQHKDDSPGDEKKFDAILRRAVETPKEARPPSFPVASGGCSGTQTPPRTSEGASRRRGRASRGSSS
jgi:hypothetical protein